MSTNSAQTFTKFWLITALLGTFSIGILLGIKLQTQKSIVTIQPSKIEEVLRYTESWYVDEIDRDQLIQQAIENVNNKKNTFTKKVDTPELVTLIQTIDKNYEGSGLDAAIVADTLLLLKPTKIGKGLIYKPY